MPKNSRGGRRSASSGSQATTTNVRPAGGTVSFVSFTDTDAQDLREEEDSRYSPSVLDAIKQYISKATDAAGSSMAQNLNHKLEHGLPLNANEKYMVKYMTQGMHDVGKDIMLYRGAHEDLLQRLGVKNYQNYTESQLKQMLVGSTFTSKSFTSASYDKSKNPFYTGPASGGREVEIIIKTPSSAKMVFGARSQAEVILGIGTNYRVTDISYTGRVATPRNSGVKKVVQLELEAY